MARPVPAKRSNPPLTPEIVSQVQGLYLQCLPRHRIAKRIGITESEVNRVLDQVVLPEIRKYHSSGVERDLAKIEHLERIAWEKLDSTAKEDAQSRIADLDAALDLAGKPKLHSSTLKALDKAGLFAGEPDKFWISVIQWCIITRCRIRGYYDAAPINDSRVIPEQARTTVQILIASDPQIVDQLQNSVAAAYNALE